MRKALIEYECPNCNAGYGAVEALAGTNHVCGCCKTDFMIPVGRQPRLVSVCETPAEELSVYDEAIEEPRQVVQKRKPKDGPVPVKMRMPGGYGELELPVRQKTADTMATTFLGALIMAIGVVLAAMLGLKKKS